MDNSGNWFTRNISIIVIVLSLYPWLLLLIASLNDASKASWLLRAGAGIAIYAFALSVINLIISIIFIVCTHIVTPSVAKNSAGRFFAINSISVVWVLLLSLLVSQG